MKISLVGYTGFVGSNIYNKAGSQIEGLYNSKNIKSAYKTAPDILIYAGLKAEKYLANTYPEKDKFLIEEAEKNIKNINPKKLILISTIDVFKEPANVDENSIIDINGLQPYGYNRYLLECWVRENYHDALIIRLPALFGDNLKKNFLYDYVNPIPQLLKKEKIEELSARNKDIFNYYALHDDQFYKVKNLEKNELNELKNILEKLGFTALNFTDSRNIYQFYNLARLWDDIHTALDHNLQIWHPATEPVSAGDIYKFLTGNEFVNEILPVPAYYNYRTVYYDIFNGRNGYINSEIQVLNQIKDFIAKQQLLMNK
mgnify:CR=1 FL=1